MPQQTYTVSVSVTFTLYSSAGAPPYEVAGCQGLISYNDNTPAQAFNGWNAEDIGTPEPNGATFTLNVADASYSSSSNVTGVANWALTFIPRGGTNQQSPFSNNENTIAGNGATNNNGVFTLNLGSNTRINNVGNWDWALMIQMVLPDGTIECFSSDPEMEVGT
jgi:hypothetical protein